MTEDSAAKHLNLRASPLTPPALRNDETAPEPLRQQEQRYLTAATADNTRRTYRSAVRQFERWGGALPADEATVIRYLLAHAETLNPRTLSLHLTALRQWHRYQGFPDPTASPQVRKTLTGIARMHGRPKRKAKAFSGQDFMAMVDVYTAQDDEPADLRALRDRTLLLIAYFGAFRRSELVRIEVAHLTWEPEGLIIALPRSKTDQQGDGKLRALPYGAGALCPVQALQAWLMAADIQDGPVFRNLNRWGQLGKTALTAASVNLILKTAARAAGLPYVPAVSSHSFRRSLATGAYRAGASFESIKRQGGWKNDTTVWEYIEEAQAFEDNAAGKLLANYAHRAAHPEA